MNTLPSSIESYLEEAGFTVLEVLILKRLLEEEALTVREIASKTGKSSGAIDQAMRRLLQKNIVTKEQINGTWKYTLHSLKAVSQWMMEDMKEKREAMTRRHQNFESFLTTLELDKKRPDIEYFDGDEGMKRAYMSILGYAKETLHYMPVICAIEDDPLRDFRVEYFRERRRKGVFSRVIAHNTSLGRRYQSRDPFEYRQTVLVPEDQYPFTFEKVIAGDMIACFNFTEKRASLIHYPELASMERGIFEGIWKKGMGETQKDSLVDVVPVPTPAKAPTVPLRTRTFSRLREFFLSRESIITFAILGVFAAAATYGLYRYASNLNLQRMKDTVKSVVATGVFQFDATDLNVLQTEEDYKRPEWAKVVNQLKEIRINNKNIIYTYILRKSPTNPKEMVFVSDSHSLNPYANSDDDPFNDVNVFDTETPNGSSVLAWPGQPYPSVPKEAYLGYEGPIATEGAYEDIWGKFISGYAPIKDNNGQVVAVLAVDMSTGKLSEFTMASFTPLIWFLVIFFAFILVRLAAFNRSLLQEVWEVFQMRQVLITILFCTELSFFLTFGIYKYTLNLIKDEIGTNLVPVVSSVAKQIDPQILKDLRFARDMKSENYQKVFQILNKMRNEHSRIKFAYILRLVQPPRLWEFVADADSNYNLSFYKDYNGNGELGEEADENVAPGVRYYVTDNSFLTAFKEQHSSSSFDTDQWGTTLSVTAPIEGGTDPVILAVGVDVSVVVRETNNNFTFWIWFLGFFSFLIVIRLALHKI